MRGHCRVKERLPPVAFDLIDWGRAEDVTSTHPDLLNLWMTKQVSGFCPAGKAMTKRGAGASGKAANAAVAAPCIALIKAKLSHGRVQSKAWKSGWAQRAWIQLLSAASLPRSASWRPWRSFPGLRQLSPEEQGRISWSHFIKRRLSRQWRAIQESHCRSTGS